MRSSHEEYFRGRLAREIDFTNEGSALESYFLKHAPGAVAGNPTASDEIVSLLLGVGTTQKFLPVQDQIDLVSRHQLTAPQKAHLLDREVRVGVWGKLIQTQTLSAEEFDRFVERDRGEEASNHLVFHEDKFGLRHDPRLLSILENATPVVRTNYLATHPGSFVEQAPRWINDLLVSNYGGTDRLAHLLVRRPDLLDAVRQQTQTKPKQLVIMAGVEHDASQQLIDVGLSDVLAIASGTERYRTAIRNWRMQCRDLVDEAIRCPFTRLSVILTMQTLLSDGLGVSDRWALAHARATETTLGKSLALIQNRLERCKVTGLYEIAGDYSTITTREEFAWLSTWLTSRFTRHLGIHLVGAGVALSNPSLPEDLRDPFEKMADALSRRDAGIERQVFIPALDYSVVSLEVCDGTCAEKYCGRRQCTYVREIELDSMTLAELHSFWSSAETYCRQSTPYGEWLHSQLGSDLACHQMFYALAKDWGGTVGELLETTKTLSK
jgi:hypothetical protein